MDLLTYKQAAEYLNIRLSTLYSLVGEGRIPHIRISSRLVRFRKLDLDDWLLSNLRGVAG